jgi:hypothetical protein
MFYLLENNRIIEDTKGKYCVRTQPTTNGKNVLCSNGKNKYRVSVIKNQSENVFDLIEMGDLLYMPFDCNGTVVHRFDMFKCYKYNAFHCSIHIVHERGIFAIYKPDDKGNYIKVWEREEEDEND